ncbi:glycosyltransferase family 1 protein [Archangium minus]|uniref:Glycosyltransferase family 1 protein n=1 Tax=Archangium minus TaxID=83450 RepID=A0ABY9WWH7_9BACT|nr:glycosyltransferase family 1 protein [Archangium minus]
MGRFFLTSRGSWGDINPILGLGRELKKRGHQVTVILNEYHRSCAEKLGFEFVPYASVARYHEEQNANSDIGGPGSLSHEERLARWHDPEMRATYAALAERADPRDSVIVARSWTLAGRLAQERLGIPLATVYITPAESVRLEPWLPYLGPKDPKRRWIYERVFTPVIDRIHDPMYGPFLNAFRAELGLAPVKHIQTRWFESPQLALGLWPDWFYPLRDHWSPGMQLPGFVFHETREDEPSPPELESFLSTGEPPVLFLAGSFRSGGAEAFFATSVEVCRRLGRRGIFLSESRKQLPASLPESIATFPYLPLQTLLPRCAAVVHHGGIGTAARGIQAAVPQLIVPVFSDQPFNADRLRQLGVADSVQKHEYTADNVVPVLRRLLGDHQVRVACQALSQRLVQRDAVAEACNALEGLLRDTRSTPPVLRRAAS